MQKKSLPNIVGVDLFCGVGGLTHGLIRGGVKIAAGFDIDKDCQYPYEANNLSTFYERDVGSLTIEEISSHFTEAEFSLLAGCAPCQPFSKYSRNNRNKNYEQQWPLVSVFGDLIQGVKPDLVTMENVPQLSTHSVFQEFLEKLNGYCVWWGIVNCVDIGVPQTRKRLVLLASRIKREQSISLILKPTKMKTVRNVIGRLPVLKAGEMDIKDKLHTASALSDLNLARIKASVPGGTWRDWPKHLQAECHKKSSGSTYPSVYGRMEWDQPSPTITTQCFGYGNGRFGHPEQNRAISLREAAMLQTFPKSYKFFKTSQPPTFGKLGRLIGNAVPVRLGEVIAQSLVSYLMVDNHTIE